MDPPSATALSEGDLQGAAIINSCFPVKISCFSLFLVIGVEWGQHTFICNQGQLKVHIKDNKVITGISNEFAFLTFNFYLL